MCPASFYNSLEFPSACCSQLPHPLYRPSPKSCHTKFTMQTCKQNNVSKLLIFLTNLKLRCSSQTKPVSITCWRHWNHLNAKIREAFPVLTYKVLTFDENPNTGNFSIPRHLTTKKSSLQSHCNGHSSFAWAKDNKTIRASATLSFLKIISKQSDHAP